MHNYSKITHRDTLTESEIYEDLSTALVCFKKKLKETLSKAVLEQQLSHDDQNIGDESENQGLRKLKQKYVGVQIGGRFQMVIQRCISRIKQSIRQAAAALTKGKVELLISIRKLQLSAFRMCQAKHYHSAICLILDYVSSFSLHNLLQLSSLPPHSRHNIPISAKTLTEIAQSQSVVENLRVKRQTQAEQFIRNAEKYKCIDIDLEYLRGRYFDLKQQQGQLLQDAYARNSYIKRAISSFQKVYQLSKERTSRSKCENRSHAKTYYLKTELSLTHNDHKFYSPSRENNSFSRSQNKTQSLITAIETKTNNQTFRSVYEEKLKEHKANTAKPKNVTVFICDEQSTQYLRNVNSKRVQFYKEEPGADETQVQVLQLCSQINSRWAQQLNEAQISKP